MEQDVSTRVDKSMITNQMVRICRFLLEINLRFIVILSIQAWQVSKTCQVFILELFPADAPDSHTNEQHTP
jgi:hypothetical protein